MADYEERSQDDLTEEPSQHRIDELRSKGTVAQKAGTPEKKPPPQRVARRGAAPAPDQEAVAPAPAPRNAKQFAGDGGAPIPAAGFLGFDGRSNPVH